MTARTSDASRPRISPRAVYRMDMEGIVLAALERTLFVRADGRVVTARATTHAGTAHLTFRDHARVARWRQWLARRLLGIRAA